MTGQIGSQHMKRIDQEPNYKKHDECQSVYPPHFSQKNLFSESDDTYYLQKQLNILSVPVFSRFTIVITYEDIFEIINIP